jgi:hypothetical protein
LGPWGIPLELELDALELDDFGLVVAAGGELFVGVAVFAGAAVLVTAAGELFVEEEEEAELPHPAAMTPATATATNGSPRTSLNLLIMVNLCLCRELGLQEPLPIEHDAACRGIFLVAVSGRFAPPGSSPLGGCPGSRAEPIGPARFRTRTG